MSDFVRVVEVGARDGLQNEKQLVPAATKVALIDRLTATGLRSIEATSFVSPKWIPQLADAAEVFGAIARKPGVRYPVLVPNLQGYERAVASGVEEIAVFTAASEAFNRKNTNATIAESIERFRPVLERAREAGIAVRGYVSTVLGCPYQGDVPVADVVRVAKDLHALGCYEISLGDTIGTGTLYLGGPASDQNLATPGFIFSQPSGRTAVDVAIGAIALPVIGQECSIDATPAQGIGHVIVTVNPPAVPTSLRLDVKVGERDGIDERGYLVVLENRARPTGRTIINLAPRGFVPDNRKLRRALAIDDSRPAALFWEQYDNTPVIDPKDEALIAKLRGDLQAALG